MTPRRGHPADVVVIGAGPAGLSAAAAAAESGRRVLLIDQGIRPGGQIWRHRDEQALPATARRALERVRAAGVVMASEARLVDATSPRELLIDFRGRVDVQQAGSVVIANGARERFLPFPGWTLPGVLGVGGLQALIKSGLSIAGQRVLIAGTGPLLLPVAAAAAGAGAHVLLVAEQAGRGALLAFGTALWRQPDKLMQAARYRRAFAGTPFHAGAWVMRAEGDDRVRTVVVRDRNRVRSFSCDWLAASAGLVPVTDAAELLGCSVRGDAVQVDDDQATTVPGIWAAGECTGVKGDAAACAEGEIAGRMAAGATVDSACRRRRNAGRRFAGRLQRTFALRPELLTLADADTILCRCEDVPRRAVEPEWSQRQAKLWTRLGMGACQGAVCGPACSALFGWDRNAVRPPLGNPSCGAWSGALDAARDDG